MVKIYGKYIKIIQAIHRRLFFLLYACFIFYSPIALAATTSPDTQTLVRWYKIYWSGIHVADLIASLSQGNFTTQIETYGLAKTISKYASLTSLEYNKNNNIYAPIAYHSKFNQRHGGRSVEISYLENGKIAYQSVTPPDAEWKRPKVPEALRKHAVDPLAAFLLAQQKIKEALEQNNQRFTIDVYDGRSLYGLDFTVYGRIKKKIKDREYSLIQVEFKRRSIAGFTANELKKIPTEEPTFTVYLSDDELLLPLKADAEAPLGTAVLFLEKECRSLNECLPE